MARITTIVENEDKRECAWKWWSNLSINEMKAFRDKYYPHIPLDYMTFTTTYALDIYLQEILDI